MNKQNIENAIAYWKEFKEEIPELKESYPETEQMLDEQEVFVATAIYCMEQQLTNGWIPDRLPPEPSKEDAEPMSYLVTLNEYAIRPIQLYYIGKGRWVREYDEPCHVYENVIAWRPEPKIYKEI